MKAIKAFLFGWRCPLCQRRYWARRSCGPCGMRIMHVAMMRALDAAILDVRARMVEQRRERAERTTGWN